MVQGRGIRAKSRRAKRAARCLKPSPSPTERARASEVGGGRGIRTPGTLPGTAVFKTAAIDHSAIPPRPARSPLLTIPYLTSMSSVRSGCGAGGLRARRAGNVATSLLVVFHDELTLSREAGREVARFPQPPVYFGSLRIRPRRPHRQSWPGMLTPT